MSKGNNKRRIREITAFAAALLMAASFSLPEGTEIMGVSFGSAVVASADDFIDNDIAFRVNGDGTLTVTQYRGNSNSVCIPYYVEYNGVQYTVTSIGNNAFFNLISLESITIPSSVTSIGDATFFGCSSLASINIPDSVTSIGRNAFSGCTSLTRITLPANSGFKCIPSFCFQGCTSLTSITIPNSVTSIENDAFSKCTNLASVSFGKNSNLNTISFYAFSECSSLVNITIPDSVTFIGNNAFSKCTNLASVSFGKNSNLNTINFYAFSECSSLVNITIPDGVTSIKSGVFKSCTKLTSITIPDCVTSIENNAFENCTSLASINIPDSVVSIENQAFYNCTSLESVSFGHNSRLTSIGDSAFHRCSRLTSITIPSGVTSIGNYAFSGCSCLTSITIPDGVNSIGDHAFESCSSLKSITIPDSVSSIETEAFSYCTGLTSIFLPEGATVESDAIPTSATQIKYTVDGGNVKITGSTAGTEQISLTIPEKIGGKAVTSIGDGAFSGCTNLVSVTLPDSITSIGDSAFIRCTSLESINIPSGVTSIGDSAFSSCPYLGSVTIPGSVTSIGTDALNCFSSITVDDSNPNYSSKNGVLFNKDGTILIAYPINKSDDSYIIPDGVKSIGNDAFVACESLTSITIPDSVTTIGKQAFQNCRNLTSITIPGSVTSIGAEAFLGCRSLASIFLPEGPDVSYASIPTSAAQIRYTFDTEGNATIKNVDLNGQSPVTFPKEIGGEPVKAVFIEEGTAGVNVPTSATAVSYTVDTDGNVTITEVTLGDGQTSFDIPSTIGGKTVTDIADNALENCPDVEHTHREKTAATCTEKPVCSICSQGYGEALGHDHSGDWLNDTADHWRVCERDDCTEIIDKEAHIYDSGVVTTEPTEETEGVMTYTCETCGYKKTESIAKLNHTHKTAEEYSMDESCHWHVCLGCDEKVDFEKHSFGEGVVTTEPTEDAEGVRTYTCETCGYKKTESIAKLNHTHKPSEEYSKDESGHWHACSGCTEKIDFEAHTKDSGTVTTQPTETSEGVRTYKCVECGYVMETETIPAVEGEHSHEYSTEWTSDRTFHWHECECGEKADVSRHISDGGKVYTQPTETDSGLMVYSCIDCGYTIDAETIPALSSEHSHEYGAEWKTDSASHWHECECGEKADVSEHISDGGRITVSPTAVSEGEKTYTCTVCGYVMKTEAVPKTGTSNGHYYPIYPTFPITSSDPGYTVSQSVFTERLTVNSATNGDVVTLSWDKVDNADKYYIYQYKNGKYVSIKSTADNSVSLKGLKDGESYQFLVRYVVDGKLSPMTYSSKFTVKVSFKPAPKAVAGKDSVKFSWKAVPGAEKYAIYKYVDGKAIKLGEVKGTSVKITKLLPDTEYSYIVRAYVDGEWTKMYKSDIVTVKTLAE